MTEAWKEHEEIQENYWWHRHKMEFLLRMAETSGYKQALEIGSAGGNLSHRLKKSCRRVTLDLTKEHVQKGGVACRLPQLCFRPDTFDLVLLSEVLEHLDRPVESLKAIHESMSAGGRCLITVPAWPALWSAHDVFYGHRKRYTPSMLVSEVAAAGFRIQKRGWIFFMPLWAAFAIRGLKKLRAGSESAPASDFIRLPGWLNRLCHGYLKFVEEPLAVRMWLPAGLTLTMVAVKPGTP